MNSLLVKQKMNQRIKGVDNLRGIAALMVVLYHFGIKFYKTGSIFFLGSYGVHIFFVISGFVILFALQRSKKGIDNALRFLGKRIIRIDPPYIATIAMVLIYSFGVSILNPDNPFRVEANRVFLHLGYLIPFGSYAWYSPAFWTLGVEFQFYLMVALLYFCPIKFSREMLIGLLILIGVFDIISPFANGEYFIMRYAGFFIAGIATSAYYTNEMTRSVFSILILVSVIISFLGLNDIIAPFILGITVLFILFLKFKNKVFDFFAKISYSLYLIHYTLMHLFYEIFDRYFETLLNKEIVFTLSIVLTLLCSYFFYLIIERPAINFSKSILLIKNKRSI
jgi:peptidoglycan/LPS O-acetylase OafA/YrhL